MQLANSFGIEKDATSGPKNRAIANDDDARLLIDTAVTLSAMAARQVFSSVQSSRVGSRSNGNAVDSAQWLTKSFDLSRSLLQSTALCCSPILLSQVVDLLQGADIALSVFSRIEGKFSQSNSSCYATHSESNFEILEHNFARDGILMSSSKVLGPLMKFCMKEMQRRKSPISNGSRASAVIASRVTAKGKSSATADRPSATPMFTMPFATDVEELVAVLQKSENHLLATRVLLGSWHISSSKSEVIKHFDLIYFYYCYYYTLLL